MRAILTGTVAAAIGSAALVGLTVAPAFAASATVTNGSETLNLPNPYPVVNSTPGKAAPTQGVWTATGFSPGSQVTVALCDGLSPTSSGWSEAGDCDYANTASVANAAGVVTFDTVGNPVTLFHGIGPSGLFNCLAPGDNPNSTKTTVGSQTIDPNVPSWGASTVGTGGGGTAPCQLYFFTNPNSYTATTDILDPVTNLDDSVLGASAPQSPLAIALPVAAAALLAGGGAFAIRRRRRSTVAA